MRNLQRGLLVLLAFLILLGAGVQGVQAVEESKKEKEKQVAKQQKKDLRDMERIQGMVEPTLAEMEAENQRIYEENYRAEVANQELYEKNFRAEMARQQAIKDEEQRVANVKQQQQNVANKENQSNERNTTISSRSNSGQQAPQQSQSQSQSQSQAPQGRVIQMQSTAYTHTGNPTATGVMPSVGMIAVDPNVIPLGTRVHVSGYGNAIATDTGGAIKGNIIDVFMNSSGECCNWGRRSVTVTILN